MDHLYLDNNATTKPAPQVVEAIAHVHEELWANPSSVHRFGQLVRQRLDLARVAVARLLGGRDREIVFTSGGTESDNLALHGVLDAALEHGADAPTPLLLTSRMEHSAVLDPGAALERRGVDMSVLPVDGCGRIDPAVLGAALADHVAPGRVILVSIQWANNETGVLQPMHELASVCREATRPAGCRIVLHTDATQVVGKIDVDVGAAQVDLLTLSAHKFHGPKGIGALWMRSGMRLRPQNLGGPQERKRRGGTENAAGIVGLGVAAELGLSFLADGAAVEKCRARRDRFERALCAALPDTVVNGGDAPRLWTTSNLGFPALEAEALLLAMSEKGLCASAGAACSSGSLEPSPVLLAMGIPEKIAHGSVRFSLSRFTTDDEIDGALEIVPQIVEKLRRTLPVG